MDEEMKRKCYERYKLRWMEEHGHGMNDLVEALRASEAQRIADGDRPTNVVDLFYAWETNEGFDGELYACYGEFCDCELQDRAYMKKLLGKLEYERYKEMM